jgi:hypothetical protein
MYSFHAPKSSHTYLSSTSTITSTSNCTLTSTSIGTYEVRTYDPQREEAALKVDQESEELLILTQLLSMSV